LRGRSKIATCARSNAIEEARDFLLDGEPEAPRWSDFPRVVKLESLVEGQATERVSVADVEEFGGAEGAAERPTTSRASRGRQARRSLRAGDRGVVRRRGVD
jgi:hypothetical protein